MRRDTTLVILVLTPNTRVINYSITAESAAAAGSADVAAVAVAAAGSADVAAVAVAAAGSAELSS